jgi:DNA-binding NarL/FixJ family response regulator
MDTARRTEILKAYIGHVRRFDEIASRPHSAAGYFPCTETEAVPAVETDSVPAPETGGLSAREREVLSLVAEGLSNREIGSKLNITEETVKSHVRRTFLRLGARNRAHAVSVGHSRGLLV